MFYDNIVYTLPNSNNKNNNNINNNENNKFICFNYYLINYTYTHTHKHVILHISTGLSAFNSLSNFLASYATEPKILPAEAYCCSSCSSYCI